MNQIFTKKETIKFRHVDFAGIVFYPRFLEMLNDLVEDWFEEALERPFSKIHETNGIPTVDLKIQFKKAGRIGEVLTKKLWVEKLGGASVTCGFKFEDENQNTVLEGEVTLVNVAISEDRNDIKSEAFSESMKSKIAPFQVVN
ncbi:4-hydroxybenzoyl-CoA thioesterase [Flavobacterium noncentrifugens]|uniref:4-hydroxybenzoyl-CoA thioesterase n=1 Tax=Flavobacterium noncentrifugens TaxID=1128970 RepID=A0A1G8ZW31_9FLAO|nr:acyl-CoA thioesterase [Flavobacterium noncentrifugens]GEP51837.1 4-hydroxybenzoyl-CoA thioesterase [Flavobacterium noncentrifugens]SDK18330.1 4-hydroxybenzoyl-CoA thioesterase [Flavobacterium noncentrifugens]